MVQNNVLLLKIMLRDPDFVEELLRELFALAILEVALSTTSRERCARGGEHRRLGHVSAHGKGRACRMRLASELMAGAGPTCEYVELHSQHHSCWHLRHL